jgi:hypothetical protein
MTLSDSFTRSADALKRGKPNLFKKEPVGNDIA